MKTYMIDILARVELTWKKLMNYIKKYSDRAMDLLLTTEYERIKEEQAVLDLLNEIVIDSLDCGCEN